MDEAKEQREKEEIHIAERKATLSFVFSNLKLHKILADFTRVCIPFMIKFCSMELHVV